MGADYYTIKEIHIKYNTKDGRVLCVSREYSREKGYIWVDCDSDDEFTDTKYEDEMKKILEHYNELYIYKDDQFVSKFLKDKYSSLIANIICCQRNYKNYSKRHFYPYKDYRSGVKPFGFSDNIQPFGPVDTDTDDISEDDLGDILVEVVKVEYGEER